jgi:MEMO1 family protein
MTIATTATRPPAVAGLFYPGDATALQRTIEALLAGVGDARRPPPKAVVAPHAGYVYSGPIAAAVYAAIAPLRGTVRRVVLLGPTHRVPVRGLALPGSRWFETPLGKVEVDPEAVGELAGMPQVTTSAAAHALEHALEVHLPFLQTVLDEFRLVPLAVGDARPRDVAEVLGRLWGGRETLIVVSSDLSHYLPYADAQKMDRTTAEAILDMRADIDHDAACGATPVAGLGLEARRRALRVELVDLRNSGDTAGDRSRVVGYGAFAYYENEGGDDGC